MARTNRSARGAGAKFERDIANYLHDNLSDFIDRRVKTGATDKGDIVNVRTQNGRHVVVECKEYRGQLKPPQWLREAEVERQNDNAFVGVVIAKRKGTTKPGEQYVLMDVDTLIKLLRGE